MRILVYGINYAPELTGIGKYSGEMVEWLSEHGHEVRMVTAPPYYPEWKVGQDYSSWCYKREISRDGRQGARDNLVVWRCPLWVPARPSGLKRLVHLASFAFSSFPVMLMQLRWKPDVVMAIEPPLMCAPTALLIAKMCNAKSWLHVQDFEVDAAFELGILKSGWLRKTALFIELRLMRCFDMVSTISGRMLERLIAKGVAQKMTSYFPNWVDLNEIIPLKQEGWLRNELGIPPGRFVALYSGNMGEKQGLEIVLEAADQLISNPEILFVLSGEGAAKARLMDLYPHLPNVLWLPLQPLEKLNDLLNLADIHLLPQRANVADLVMPSKLSGMLASGRPVLATARTGTQLAKLVASCGKVVEPGDVQGFVEGLLELARSPQSRAELGSAARNAAQAWDKTIVLHRFEEQLNVLCNN